ncbi:hypothetical protein P7D22_19570 [Lichenihabitans sp. Uapishka_5]|uniref:hypothetical protein n=1 Tax=Lichenihabitans sp. Uapishka_5 TaxID=3037302 RepID=UPI0029E7DB61|nr:hypothetical protein [Lichenihabitans sp. Uapishka_5]MDX7953367.1 hypothetical protein [Lichenihabitans sp. Uapishka_5]
MSGHPEAAPDVDEPEGAFTFDDLLADQQDERRWKAFHEGGHIAVAWAIGAYPISADIIDKPPRGGLAVYLLGNDGHCCSVGDVTICFAGPAAAKRHAPRRRDGGDSDRENIARHLAALCRTQDVAAIVSDHCEREAKRLVDENWDAVEAIAAALLEREALTDLDIADVLAPVRAAREDAEHRRQRRAWAATLSSPLHPSITIVERTYDVR